MEELLRLHISQQQGTPDRDGDTLAELISTYIPSKISGKMSGYQWPNLPEAERTAIIDMLPPPSTASKRGNNNGLRQAASRRRMNASRMSEEAPTIITSGGGGGRDSSGSSNGRRSSIKEASTEEATLAKLLVEKVLSNKWTSVHEVVLKSRDKAVQVGVGVS